MADNSVFISGAGSGAFLEAFEGLPPWATEDTATNIEGILKKSLGIQTKALSQMMKGMGGGGKPLSPADAKKLNDELSKTLKNFRDLNRDMDKRKRRGKEEEDQHNRKKKFWEKENELDAVRLNIGAQLIKLGTGVKDAMISNVSIFDQLYASGINVVSGFDSAADGFDALRQLSAITGIRFTELAATIVKYNAAINSFGLEKFGKTLGMAKDGLAEFGYGTKEAGDLLGAYLETQRGFADFQHKTQTEVTADLLRFAERITRVSTATGMLRTQILANLDAISKQTEASLLAGQIGESAAEQTAEFIASFKDQKIGQSFLRMMTDIIKPLNTTFMDFQKLGFGGFGQKLMTFTQTLQGLPAEEAQKRVAEFMAANKAEVSAMEARANLYRQVGMKEADSALSTLVGLKQQERAYRSVSEADRKKLQATAKSSKDLQNAWENFKAQLQITFAPLPKILEMFTQGLVWLNEGFNKIRSWVGDVESFINSFKEITDVTGKINLLPWIGIGLIGVSALASLKMIFGVFKYAFSLLSGSISLVTKSIGWVAKSVMWVGKTVFSAGKHLLTAGQFIMNALKPVGAVILRLAPMLLRLLGPVALLYSAFQVGSAIGETIYETVSQFDWFNNAMETVFSGIESSWKFITRNASLIGSSLSSASSYVSEKISESGDYISSKFNNITNAYSTIISLVSGIFKGIMRQAETQFLSVINFVADGIKSVRNFFVEKFSTLFTSIGSSISAWFPWIKDVTNFLSGFSDTARNFFTEIKSFGNSFVNSLQEFLTTVMKKFADKMIPDFMKFWKTPQAEAPATKKTENQTAIDELFRTINQQTQMYRQSGLTAAEIEKGIKPLVDKLNVLKSNEQEQKKVEPQTPKINNVVSLPELKTTAGTSRLSAPKPSELNSPSEVSTKPQAGKDGPVDAKKTDVTSGAGLRKENSAADINTVIGYQTSVLEQILQSTNNLVSVNQDILRYTRVNT